MVGRLKEAVTSQLMRIQLQFENQPSLPEQTPLPPMELHHIDATSGADEGTNNLSSSAIGAANTVVMGEMNLEPAAKKAKKLPKFNAKKPETWGKVARNDDCPCGSGKKYKHCHGSFAEA